MSALDGETTPGYSPRIEVQTGSYLSEDDIERFEDKYGRAPARGAEVAKP